MASSFEVRVTEENSESPLSQLSRESRVKSKENNVRFLFLMMSLFSSFFLLFWYLKILLWLGDSLASCLVYIASWLQSIIATIC